MTKKYLFGVTSRRNKVYPIPPTVRFNETFEYPDWDETFPVPNPTFPIVSYNESFEFAGGWDDTGPIPTPTFGGAAEFDEDYDSDWDGT